MTLELKKFDMKNITFKPNENKGPVIVLIGRRDTGKRAVYWGRRTEWELDIPF